MKPVGTRSISLLFLLLVLVTVAAVSGLFRASTLEAITPDVAVCLGVFTVLAGTGLFRFWDLGSPSRSYFRMSYRGPRWEGEQAVIEGKGLALLAGPAGREPPREIPAVVSRVLAQAACLLVALLCFNKRTVALMFETPGELASAGSQVCPVEVPEEKPVEVEKPGCELIIRAHALGYVKDLGTCAPSEEEKKIELCHLRQHDEPFLHYSGRLFARFVRQVRLGIGGPGFFERVRTTFETQLAHREPLIGRQRSVVASAPKASHHIFTNLPYPEGRVRHWLRDSFEPNGCFTRFRQLP
ncbi:MAG TPA: hypothetical protein VM598_00865, partial [Bdellovibrionota bacterium]|nr:hypothetical protein [Bdellovibrionota bacterium]